MNTRHLLSLAGLDGSNPLAFLAALGTLRTLTRAWPVREPRLAWNLAAGRWVPTLSINGPCSEEDLAQALDGALASMKGHRAFGFAKDLKVAPTEFSNFARDAARSARTKDDGVAAEFAAAFGCEACLNADGTIQDTEFRTMSGAGHQHFLGFMDELTRVTTAAQVRAALFAPWRYDDERLSLRWDPIDDRRYALRWRDPSGDTIRTVRGANRLAIEGLPFFPVMPADGRLITTGFSRGAERGVFWTWPIWESPLTADACRSLLALAELQSATPDRARLGAMGIVEIFRCERITVGKFRNFSPAFSP